eukprot:1175971-Pyramimonas_sp.AAC.1
MRRLQKGRRREELFTNIDEHIKKHVVCVNASFRSTFKQGARSAGSTYCMMRTRRTQRVEEGRQRSEGLHEGGADASRTEVEKELKRATAALTELREAHVAAEREGIVREIWEAYKENRFADMHRHGVEYQRNGRGPKKRF